MSLEDIGLNVPTVLLPKKGVNLQKWAVIACDQYNQDSEYWESVRSTVGESPSALNIVLPEIYLSQQEEIIPQIEKNTWIYQENHLNQCSLGFVLVERTLLDGSVRKGLMAALELKKYGRSESGSLIRATENTLPDKLAVRKRIRRGAAIEIPHTITLIDDTKDIVLGALSPRGKILYDFDLMKGAGHLRGTLIEDEKTIERIANNLASLADPELQSMKYGLKGIKPVLFADGDGNHGMSAAKELWEESKAELPSNHPSRYTLVEIVNIHSPAVQFKPIHRVVSGNSLTDILNGIQAFYGRSTSISFAASKEEAVNLIRFGQVGMHNIRFLSGETHGVIRINPTHSLAVGTLQEFLDYYVTDGNGIVDYVHGEANTDLLCSRDGNVGLYLPSLPKDDFFRTIMLHDILPKKAFSIGEPNDKRFYMEARKLF